MNVSGGTTYSMYKQEKYANINWILKRRRVYIIDKDAKTVRGHVAQLITLTKFICQVVSSVCTSSAKLEMFVKIAHCS